MAEDLYGQRGVYAVSLREMNARCGISQGVLHYHFGGRERLVEAILDRQLPAISEARRRRVEALLQAGSPPGPRGLAEVLVEPVAELAMADEAGLRFVRFLGRLHQDNNELYIELVSRHSRESNLSALLPHAFAGLDGQQIELLLGMALDVMFRTLATLHQTHRSWQSALRGEPVAPRQRVSWLVDFIARGFGECSQPVGEGERNADEAAPAQLAPEGKAR